MKNQTLLALALQHGMAREGSSKEQDSYLWLSPPEGTFHAERKRGEKKR
jgi:hypothetical protein